MCFFWVSIFSTHLLTTKLNISNILIYDLSLTDHISIKWNNIIYMLNPCKVIIINFVACFLFSVIPWALTQNEVLIGNMIFNGYKVFNLVSEHNISSIYFGHESCFLAFSLFSKGILLPFLCCISDGLTFVRLQTKRRSSLTSVYWWGSIAKSALEDPSKIFKKILPKLLEPLTVQVLAALGALECVCACVCV